MQEPSDEYESGTVTRELQKGYKVGERVIRPSLVYVAE
jgi:molecular chaperone GrpE